MKDKEKKKKETGKTKKHTPGKPDDGNNIPKLGIETEFVDDNTHDDDLVVDAEVEDKLETDESEKENEAAGDTHGETEAEGESAAQAEEVVVELSGEEIREIIEEKNDLRDKLLRTAADYDNYIKRARKDRDEIRESTTAGIISSFLPVIDNFERALAAEESNFIQLFKGLEMVFEQMIDVLKNYNVEPITAAGKIFDPEYHEAMITEPTADYPNQTIIEEYVTGYIFNDKLLRPSRVKVAIEMDEKDLENAKEKLKKDIEQKRLSSDSEDDTDDNNESEENDAQ